MVKPKRHIPYRNKRDPWTQHNSSREDSPSSIASGESCSFIDEGNLDGGGIRSCASNLQRTGLLSTKAAITPSRPTSANEDVEASGEGKADVHRQTSTLPSNFHRYVEPEGPLAGTEEADIQSELDKLARDEMTEFRKAQKARLFTVPPEGDGKDAFSDADADFQHLRTGAHNAKTITGDVEDRVLREQANHHLAVEALKTRFRNNSKLATNTSSPRHSYNQPDRPDELPDAIDDDLSLVEHLKGAANDLIPASPSRKRPDSLNRSARRGEEYLDDLI